METVSWFEVINNATPHPLVFYLFIFSSCMCIPFHCVQSTFFFQMTRLRRKRKDDAEQEANYKRIKITEKHKQGPGLRRQKKKEKCVCVYVCICICVCVRAPKNPANRQPFKHAESQSFKCSSFIT